MWLNPEGKLVLPFAVNTVFLEEDEEATAGVAAPEGVEAEGVTLLLLVTDAGDPVEDALVLESGPGGKGEGIITRRGCSGRPLEAVMAEMADKFGGGEKAVSTLDT